jgi:hypothetical protein
VYRQLGLLRADAHPKGALADALLAELIALGASPRRGAQRLLHLQES